MRCRIDISPETKDLLDEMKRDLDYTGITIKELVESCIRVAYENSTYGYIRDEEINPVLDKIKEIKQLLEDVLPEI